MELKFSSKILTYEETEELYGITKEQIERWDEAWCRGDIPDEPLIVKEPGRPRKFDEEMQIVGFRLPISTVRFADERASELDMSRSDYLRHLVNEDLKSAGLITAD